ncbi:MAG TPA: DUF1361 domain-containing protein [Candidatus Dormibacteraeota bacterium]|nr:DUF1361 domain-containing protein [Candidatus Dormibacteraeota bacterium]
MSDLNSSRGQFILALLVASLMSGALFLYQMVVNRNLAYSYLPWNLILAWLPFLFSLRLTQVLRTKLWSSWEALAWSGLWLVFVPNSFYMISDFIHLKEVPVANVLFAAVLFSSFIYTAVLLGLSSLFLVHQSLNKRLLPKLSAGIISGVLLLCSIAVYIGRDLRWNSWDVVVNPVGLLFDLSDRLLHPNAYPQMIVTISSFFILLSSMYGLAWFGLKQVARSSH